MISYEAFKVLHLISVLTLFAVLGGVAVHAMNGGTLKGNAARRIVASLHGIALLVAIIAGFGLMARLDLMRGGIPLWVWGKVAIWVITMLLLTLPYRRPALARSLLLFGLPVLGGLAAWLAVYKPGG